MTLFLFFCRVALVLQYLVNSIALANECNVSLALKSIDVSSLFLFFSCSSTAAQSSVESLNVESV